ncbi:hypothetical protein [Legionella sp. 16cNR16C]|uniref:hypothetical protein n=1 Tax=Legionella sp. 16cNR16C TaxID=2905656 RepID=UPI001E572616|nr:hypothetical protein [Legionella sp. 16cNR16C]MCE3044141.1 hypothetical protein [Legionella sp. 16cNR16C]
MSKKHDSKHLDKVSDSELENLSGGFTGLTDGKALYKGVASSYKAPSVAPEINLNSKSSNNTKNKSKKKKQK